MKIIICFWRRKKIFKFTEILTEYLKIRVFGYEKNNLHNTIVLAWFEIKIIIFLSLHRLHTSSVYHLYLPESDIMSEVTYILSVYRGCKTEMDFSIIECCHRQFCQYKHGSAHKGQWHDLKIQLWIYCIYRILCLTV